MGNIFQKSTLLNVEIVNKFPKVKNENIKNNIIDRCIKYKKITYYRFLIIKINFQEIVHKKIV